MTVKDLLEPYKNAAAAILYLIGGTIVTIITYYVLPSIISIWETNATNEGGGIWNLLLMIFWGAILIAAPGYKAITAIQTIGTDQKNRLIGAMWLTFALIISYFAWYMIPAIANMLPDSTLTMMFWIGFIITWTTTAIILPIIAMTKAHG